MDFRHLLPLIVALLAFPAGAAATRIYQCPGENGEPLFSNTPCGAQAELVQLRDTSIIEGGEALRIRTQRQLDGLRKVPAPTPASAGAATIEGLGFSERATMRKLEIEVDGLRRDLSRARGAQRTALAEQLREREQALRALRARQ